MTDRSTMLARWQRLQERIERGEVRPTDAQRSMVAQALKRAPVAASLTLPPLREQYASGPLPWPGGVPRPPVPEPPALDHPQPAPAINDDDEEPPWN